MSELASVREEFVQFWGQMAHFWALSPAAARVHAWLLTNTEPADTDTIMEGLGLSRGAVSMACKELRDWGLVLQEKAPGSRRITFRPETDFERVVRAIAENRKRREWTPVLHGVEGWAERLKGERSAEAKEVRARLLGLQGLLTMVESLADDFLKGGTIRSFGMKMLMRAARRSQSPASSRRQ